jgi:uncharacterized protein (DUF488 family)
VSTRILTIGHSTRTLEDFIGLLLGNGVTVLVDIRTIGRSRRNPQFNAESLPAALSANGIVFRRLPGLGGLRHARPDSVNTGWRNLSFRGYADYMQTIEFASSIDELIALARPSQVAMMCAEAVPWRCHRWLVSDALLVRGVIVEHIIGPGTRRSHHLTSWAKVEDGRIWYPQPAGRPGLAS